MNIPINSAETDEALGAAGPGSLLTQPVTAGTADDLSTAATAGTADLSFATTAGAADLTADAIDLIISAAAIGGLQEQALPSRFQQLMHALRSTQSPEQQQKILAIFKSNPHLMAAFIKERQAQAAARSAATGFVGDLPPQLQQMLNQQRQKQQQLQGGMQQIPTGLEDASVRLDVVAIAGMYREELQQLLQKLRTPQTPEQKQEILAILKANPQLMAAFIKQRQEQIARAQLSLQVQHKLSQQHQQESDMELMQAMIGDLCLEDLVNSLTPQ